MDATFEWDNAEQTIMLLRQHSRTQWTVDDQIAFIDDLLDTLMRRRQPTMIVIVCAPENTPIPNYMALINHLRHCQLDNIKGAVFVKANMFLRTFVDLVQRLNVPASKEIHHVDNVTDAMAMAQTVLGQFSKVSK